MAAYLVGTRGTTGQALLLGLTVTLSHTVGVLALGLVVLRASHIVSPELLYPWLSFISGLMIIGIGCWLFMARWRGKEHTHSHEHPHVHDLTVSGMLSSSPGDLRQGGLTRYWRRAVNTMTRLRHGHAHEQVEPPTEPRKKGRLQVTWKSLTALGIVGGMVPSASALIILLAAISLNRVGFGLLLILAFSAGMAGVLTGVGIFLVHARRLVDRFARGNGFAPLLQRVVPWVTAVFVLVSGFVVATRAVFQLSLL